MKENIIYFILLFYFFFFSEEKTIQNGESIDITEKKVNLTYNFIVPNSVSYTEAILLFRIDFNYSLRMLINDEGQISYINFNGDLCYFYRLSSIKSKIITFELNNYFELNVKFIMLDLTKENNINFDDFLGISYGLFYSQFQ